jgi:hypothetical protein
VRQLIAPERINKFTANLERLKTWNIFQEGEDYESVLSSSPGKGGLCLGN